jgi:hypothetical protein
MSLRCRHILESAHTRGSPRPVSETPVRAGGWTLMRAAGPTPDAC